MKDKVLTLPVPRGSRDAGVARYLFRMMTYWGKSQTASMHVVSSACTNGSLPAQAPVASKFAHMLKALPWFGLKQATAAADLSYAFEHCPRDAEANRARCVYYLVPVKMLLGELPREEVLQRYGLTQYAPIVQVQLL